MTDQTFPPPVNQVRLAEVFRLRVGCPPEHLFERLRLAVDTTSIAQIVDECLTLRPVPSSGATWEGGTILEFRFSLFDEQQLVVRRFAKNNGM